MRRADESQLIPLPWLMVLAGQDLIADPRDQVDALPIQTAAGVVRRNGTSFQYRVRGDHLARHQVLPNTEMFERPLRLRAPELVRRNLDIAETVRFHPDFDHAGVSRDATTPPNGGQSRSFR